MSLLFDYKNLEFSPVEYINYITLKLGERSLYKNKFVQNFLQDYIDKYNLKSYKESVYFITQNLTEKPKCKICSKETRFKKEENRYLTTCSVSCSNKLNSIAKAESNKNSFLLKKLPKLLEENNVEIIGEYKGIKEENNFRCLKCGNTWTQKNIHNGIYCRECTPKIAGYSLQEKEVLNYIKSIYDGKILENDRSLDIELDIYVPELNIAIEYNGLYWHSSKFKEKKYHLNKTEICENNNIQLIHIFENEWLNKKEIVKSILKAKLGKTTNRIYARKCKIKEVPSKIANDFLDKNHIQGKDNAPIRYGLYYNGDLVQLMTLKRSHRSKEKYMELKRSCSILNTNVIGGFSKLLKYVKSKINEDIITFGDRRYSYKENVYSKIGKFIAITPPNHFYINGNILEGREKYQKHKLKDIFENFDSSKTAIQNCHDNDLYEIYDCGNWKYIL